ncbi:MAG: hypothetical protein E6J74_41355 [Deltaproteobacteria bacterium]|nr:MAG: hypothetical protein E6J74_41355 [Deltaproteobacteria bacterium]
MSKGYVDADGHIMEKAEELIKYLEEPWRSAEPVIPRRLLPTGDDFHTPRIRRKGIFNEAVGPEHWLDYLAKTGLEFTVLYPTAGLAHGYVINPERPGVYARAWNNYVADQYLKRSPQFKAVALIPMQDVSGAVVELRRAVKELGMVGAYVPSNGLRKHLSAKEFWPVYEEAEKLDCPIGIHGGWYRDLGFDTFTRFPGTRALGMPFPLRRVGRISQTESRFSRRRHELDSDGHRQAGTRTGVWRASLREAYHRLLSQR